MTHHDETTKRRQIMTQPWNQNEPLSEHHCKRKSGAAAPQEVAEHVGKLANVGKLADVLQELAIAWSGKNLSRELDYFGGGGYRWL